MNDERKWPTSFGDVFRPGSEKIRWFCSLIEQEAVTQVHNTASMPFVHAVAVMPDVHFGKGSTVGTVIATKGAVMPACVGVDIGCGMIAVRTNLKVADVRAKAAEIRKGIERRIPLGIGPRGMNHTLTASALSRIAELEALAAKNWADINHMNQRAKDWRNQLGSLGGGNHFIEVCVGKAVEREYFGNTMVDNTCGAAEEVWVILHSGSRGVGNKTGTYWTNVAKRMAKEGMYDSYLPDPDLAYIPEKCEEYWQYMKELYWCQEYARLNREEMMDRVLLELAFTVVGVEVEFNDPECSQDGCGTRGLSKIEVPNIEVERINCHHNYVAKENHEGTNFTVTRKGAILAADKVRGLIPGSMGARSYIVEGLGHSGSFCSAPHGAGRRMSRNAARKAFNLEGVTKELADLGIEANVREAIIDEAPGAYKDIDQVMHDARELVRPTHVLSQIISVKGD